MPLDPSIPLSANQPKAPDLIGQAMQAYTLKSAMMQTQAAEQSLQAQQLLSSVISDPNAHMEDPSVPGLQTLKPEAWQKLQTNPIAFKQAKEAERQMLQDYSMKSALKQKQTDEFYKRAGPIALSLVAEQEKGKLDDASMQPKIDEAVAGLKAQGLQVPPGLTMAQVKQFAAQVPEYQKRLLGPTPAEQERAKPQFVRELEAAGFKQGTPEFKREMDKRIAKETTPPKTTINTGAAAPDLIPAKDRDKTGDDYLKSLPTGERNLIKGIAEGRISPTSLSIRGGHREKILAQVSQYDPTFDATTFPVRAAVRKDFTSGVAARNVTAINTAIGHLGTMSKLTQELANKQLPAWNQLANALGVQLGKEQVGNVELTRQAVGDELMRVFRQVGASEVEAKGWSDRFKTASSPEQFRGAIKTATELLGSRIEALDDQWRRGMNTDKGYKNLLSEKSKKVFQEIGGNLGRYGVGEGGGEEKPSAPDKSVPGSGEKRKVYNPATRKFDLVD